MMTKRIVLFSLLGLVALGLVVGAGTVARGAAAPAAASPAQKQLYRCPMHPKVVQDHEGSCPICGMRLVPVTPAAKAGAESTLPACGVGESGGCCGAGVKPEAGK
jgi:hypothetical protein